MRSKDGKVNALYNPNKKNGVITYKTADGRFRREIVSADSLEEFKKAFEEQLEKQQYSSENLREQLRQEATQAEKVGTLQYGLGSNSDGLVEGNVSPEARGIELPGDYGGFGSPAEENGESEQEIYHSDHQESGYDSIKKLAESIQAEMAGSYSDDIQNIIAKTGDSTYIIGVREMGGERMILVSEYSNGKSMGSHVVTYDGKLYNEPGKPDKQALAQIIENYQKQIHKSSSSRYALGRASNG